MNYDGKAFVNDVNELTYKLSTHGAVIINADIFCNKTYLKASYNNCAIRYNSTKQYGKKYNIYTVSLLNDAKCFPKSFNPVTCNIDGQVSEIDVISDTFDKSIFVKNIVRTIPLASTAKWLIDNSQHELTNKDHKVYTTHIYEPNINTYNIQYTNIEPHIFSAAVIDTRTEIYKKFPMIQLKIKSDTPVEAPSAGGHSNIEVTIQKHEFIEIKFPNAVTDIKPIPDGCIFINNTLRGTITKSGDYEIDISYGSEYQKLLIHVPYYKRTL